MTHEAAFRTVFRAKKGTKKHSKYLISVSLCYLRYLDVIPKSDFLAVSYPLSAGRVRGDRRLDLGWLSFRMKRETNDSEENHLLSFDIERTVELKRYE